MTQEPIRPPNAGLTLEAAEALGLETEIPNDPTGTDSETVVIDADFAELPPMEDFPSMGSFVSSGDTVDAEVINDPETVTLPAIETRSSSRSRRAKRDNEPRDAKSGAPSLEEWERFFSRVVMRCVQKWYINWAFRGVDEDLLTERELDRLDLTDDELDLITVPFAELSAKSRFMRKHGRMIVASGDAVNALIVLGAWASRVNRIANKYKPKHAKPVRGEVYTNGSSRQGSATPNGTHVGTNNGRIPDGFYGPIYPGTG